MRIVRANPSWVARLTFVALGAAAAISVFFCLESTVRPIERTVYHDVGVMPWE